MPRLRSLYICYLSLEDPLVETQVLAYLEGLARAGHVVHLLTFEPAGISRDRRREIRRGLERRGIRWRALRYHKRPTLPATAFDTACGAAACAWLSRRHRLGAVHARGQVPAAMALLARPLTRAALIFDMRGLMAEENVDAGRWRRNGLPFRLIKLVEHAALRRATATVVLTERMRTLLGDRDWPGQLFVIPCCADTERIERAAGRREQRRAELGVNGRPVVVYLGKLGGWYLTREMVEFFDAARGELPGAYFLVLTQGESGELEGELARRGIDPDQYAVRQVPAGEVGEFLAAADAALSFVSPLPSKIASSPTKIGEYLAAGLPVVSTAGIGDVERQLDGVGVIVGQLDPAAYRDAARRLAELVSDASGRQRRIGVAREQLSLTEVGLPAYCALYEFVASASRRR